MNKFKKGDLLLCLITGNIYEVDNILGFDNWVDLICDADDKGFFMLTTKLDEHLIKFGEI